MIIGRFNYDPKQDIYTGEIKTLSFGRTNVVFRPTRKSVDREPDYRITEEGATGIIEFGAAWCRRSEKGQTYLSVALDDPALGQPLSLALFSDTDETATLVWNRPRAKAPEAKAEGAETPAAPPAARTRRAGQARTAQSG